MADPWDDPEAPDEEDLERFGGDMIRCPDCGEEIYDEAPRCPSCGTWLSGADRAGSGRLPAWLVALVVALILISFLLVYVIR